MVLLCMAAATGFAQDKASAPMPPEPAAQITASAGPSDPQTALMTVLEPKHEMDPTGLSPLGDDFSPTTGTITFSATDISIPGNFAIPVELRRWVPSDDSDTGGPAGWKWNIPYIRGHYLDVRDGHSSTGWDWGNTDTWRYGKNCTGSADTVIDNAGELIAANAYWQGKQLHIPGVTSETFVTTNGGEQLTKSHFKIIDGLCINDNPSDAQGLVQQGIVVKGPDGTTYTFNQIKTYFNGKASLKGPIVRTRLLMISSIKDRFGNEVSYNYDTEGRFTGVKASDGREIVITYQNGAVYQASAHGRTWTYGASGVTLPDGQQWSYAGLSALAFKPNGIIGGYNQQVRVDVIPPIVPGCSVAAGDYVVTINSPAGLTTTYTFRDTIHYRSNVEPDLYRPLHSVDTVLSRALNCTVRRSLVSKTSSGPGVGPYTWNYTYSYNRGTYTEASIPQRWLAGPFDLPAPVGGYPAPVVAGGAVNYRSVTVSGPDKQSVFYIDRQFQSISEERVVAQDTLSADGNSLLERSEFSFGLGAEVGMHWYMCPCEGAYPPINEKQLSHHINQTLVRTIRYVNNIADATFTTHYPDFDARGRAMTVIRSGSVGALARTERVVYDQDNTRFGVMGQVKSITVDGISHPMVEHEFDTTTAQRTLTKKFNIVQAKFQYHADGNLWKHIDGLDHATVYTDYHRGQPQRIDRANGSFETADVNDWGLVTGRIDPTGHSWGYEYDAALRLEKVTPPTGWSETIITYERASGAAYGVPAGHWRQTVDRGNARTVTYFDVLWRPLMVRSYDTGNEAGTRKVAVNTFDVGGQLVFESYPRREATTVGGAPPGRRMHYDALNRITRLETDSETHVLVTSTEYLSGFKIRVTNPRSKVTTQSLWAQDDPNNAKLATVTAPEGVNVAITRNVLGNPTAVRRWGDANGVGADVTRSYVYDAGQRLCKTLEPEVIATVQDYDLAGNVAWRAPGVNLSGDDCESEASVPSTKKISYNYDVVNQLEKVIYGDGSPGITRTYWNDGLLRTIESNGALWTYEYNSLRKRTAEKLAHGGKNYDFGWNYDTNGNVSALTYPSGGPNPAYAPNALGEPSQVGSYATDIAFHPNGAISGFTFGNNIVHSLTQTVEGRAKLTADGVVLNDLYTYDANGNVGTIVDQRSSPSDGTFSRTMTYDDLDRLAGVAAPGLWSSATYVYDPVDNLRTATVGPRVSTLNYGSANKRLANVVTNGVTTAYDYDSNGNIWHKGGESYTFDLGNRLASASRGGSYAYDGHGRRVKIMSGDGTSRIQVYDQAGQLLWSEKNAVDTFQATVNYACSTGTLAGQQCLTASTYPATTSLSCDAGDSRNDSICTHSSQYAATASYSCPGSDILSGNNCTRDDSYTASVSYTCDADDVGTGSTCSHASSYTATPNYSCPSGASLSGDNCSRNDDYTASVSNTCSAGDALNGSTCTHTGYVAAALSHSCPTGYTLSGTTCSTTTTVVATTSYSCNGAGTVNGTGICVGAGLSAYSYDEAYDACLAQGDGYGLSLDSVTLVRGKHYNCNFQANATYSCPAGGVLNGAQCVSMNSQTATATYSCSTGTLTGEQCAVPQTYAATPNYSCPNAGTLSDSTCLKTTVFAATAAYSCPNGGSLSGTSCTQTSTYSASSSYSCPDGGTQSGGTCLKSTVYEATAAYSCPSGGSLGGSSCTQTRTYMASSSYDCPSGGTLADSTCTLSSAAAATPSYSCPNGSTPSGDQCTGESTTKTAYIYLEGKQIAEAVIGGATQYVHTDALGSPVAHTNQAGSVLNRTRFEPYGYTAGGTTPGPTLAGLTTTGSSVGFTGHVNDPETDLVYMQQRYYDPIAGRFLSIDPVVTDANTGGSFNRYNYAANNPYKYIDPDGRNPIAARAVYAAAYKAATWAGAATIGSLIGIGIYDAVQSAKKAFSKPDAPLESRRPSKEVKAGADAAATDSQGNLICTYCGDVMTTVPGKSDSREYDHIDPWADGGDSSSGNIVSGCLDCNRGPGGKHKQTPEQWGGKQGQFKDPAKPTTAPEEPVVEPVSK